MFRHMINATLQHSKQLVQNLSLISYFAVSWAANHIVCTLWLTFAVLTIFRVSGFRGRWLWDTNPGHCLLGKNKFGITNTFGPLMEENAKLTG